MNTPGVRPMTDRQIDITEAQCDHIEYMKELTSIVRSLHSSHKKANEVPPGEDPEELPINVGDWVKLRVHKRKWNQPRWMGPFQVTIVSPRAL